MAMRFTRLWGGVFAIGLLAGCASTAPIEAPKNPIVAQKLSMASGDLKTLDTVMEKLIGEWHQDPQNFSEAGKAWMKKNNISGFYDTFSWGPNKAWMNFGDFQIKDGKPLQTGIGMISWHPGFQHLRFRESGGRGGFVDGMIEIIDDNTFVRHYAFFPPNTEKPEYYSDTWTFNPKTPNCFYWQSAGYENGVAKPGKKRKFCKSIAKN